MTELPRPGDLLAGKYRVERVLGEGGMGVVLAAKHLRLDELVAIKLMRVEMAQHAEFVERFLREARAASKIKSDHVVRISDVDTLASGAPYMVMEHLSGRDLSSKLRDEGALGIVDTVGFILQACDVLAEAHALGIVHRDLKPANLFLAETRDGGTRVKVLDFGISKFVGAAAGQEITRTATMLGSPMYMSPEQMLATRDVDGRTDIWSLGVVLYQLLAGQAPFRAETIPQVCALVLQTEPPRLRDLRPDVPEGLEAVVHRCLQKEPARRFPAVLDLVAALVPFGPAGSGLQAHRISRIFPRADPGITAPLGADAAHPAPGHPPSPSGTVLIAPAHRASDASEGVAPAKDSTPQASDSPRQAARPASGPVMQAVATPAPTSRPGAAAADAASDARWGTPSTGAGVSAALPLKTGGAPRRLGAPAVLAILTALAVLGIAAMVSFRVLGRDGPTDSATTWVTSPLAPATISGQPSPQASPPSDAQPSMADKPRTDDTPRTGDSASGPAQPAPSAPAAPMRSIAAAGTSAPPATGARRSVAPRPAPIAPKSASTAARPAAAQKPKDPFGDKPE